MRAVWEVAETLGNPRKPLGNPSETPPETPRKPLEQLLKKRKKEEKHALTENEKRKEDWLNIDDLGKNFRAGPALLRGSCVSSKRDRMRDSQRMCVCVYVCVCVHTHTYTQTHTR